jgi:hypothetical protein
MLGEANTGRPPEIGPAGDGRRFSRARLLSELDAREKVLADARAGQAKARAALRVWDRQVAAAERLLHQFIEANAGEPV